MGRLATHCLGGWRLQDTLGISGCEDSVLRKVQFRFKSENEGPHSTQLGYPQAFLLGPTSWACQLQTPLWFLFAGSYQTSTSAPQALVQGTAVKRRLLINMFRGDGPGPERNPIPQCFNTFLLKNGNNYSEIFNLHSQHSHLTGSRHTKNYATVFTAHLNPNLQDPHRQQPSQQPIKQTNKICSSIPILQLPDVGAILPFSDRKLWTLQSRAARRAGCSGVVCPLARGNWGARGPRLMSQSQSRHLAPSKAALGVAADEGAADVTGTGL